MEPVQPRAVDCGGRARHGRGCSPRSRGSSPPAGRRSPAPRTVTRSPKANGSPVAGVTSSTTGGRCRSRSARGGGGPAAAVGDLRAWRCRCRSPCRCRTPRPCGESTLPSALKSHAYWSAVAVRVGGAVAGELDGERRESGRSRRRGRPGWASGCRRGRCSRCAPAGRPGSREVAVAVLQHVERAVGAELHVHRVVEDDGGTTSSMAAAPSRWKRLDVVAGPLVEQRDAVVARGPGHGVARPCVSRVSYRTPGPAIGPMPPVPSSGNSSEAP